MVEKMSELTEKARLLKNAYCKQWRDANPDRIRKYTKTYWEKQAAKYSIADEVRKLSEAGSTQREIAEKLNISLGSVNKIMNARMNIE